MVGKEPFLELRSGHLWPLGPIHDLAVQWPLHRLGDALGRVQNHVPPKRVASGDLVAPERMLSISSRPLGGCTSPLCPGETASKTAHELLVVRPRDLLLVEEATGQRPLLVEGVYAAVRIACGASPSLASASSERWPLAVW